LNELAHGVDIHAAGQQLRSFRRIDAVVATMPGRRAGDAEMHFPGAGVAHHLDDLHRRRAAHDGIVDQHDALAFDQLAVRVVLALHTRMAGAVRRLDEGAADIVRADNTEFERDAGLLRIAYGCRHAAIRHRNDQICLDRGFLCQLYPDLLARFVNRAVVEYRVRPAEVDMLEDAGAG